MKTVLILDANQRSALAATRSLGRLGLKVITADEVARALAAASRWSQAYVRYPSPAQHGPEFISAIVTACQQHAVDLLLPMTELSMTLLLEQRASLADVCLPVADKASIEQLADKCRLMTLARSLDIPVPPGRQYSQPDQVDARSQSYPLVLKPGKSWLPGKDGWLHSSVRFAETPAQAEQILARDPAFAAGDFLLQQNVPGHGAGVFALYDHGRAVAFFAHRRLREKPPRGGVSVLSQSIAVDPELQRYARALLDHVGWHGIAMVEFRVDEVGNRWLMEVNTRFWGSLQLAIDAGVDFPALLYRLSQGEKPGAIEHYRHGRRLRWLLGDLDSLYLTLRDREFGWRHKLGAVARFLWPRPLITRHEVNRLSDLAPFWRELRQYFASLKT